MTESNGVIFKKLHDLYISWSIHVFVPLLTLLDSRKTVCFLEIACYMI